MRRTLVSLALILALVTGAVLDATRIAMFGPVDVSSSWQPPNVGLVHAYYDAINAALDGDAAPLWRVLGPNLVDHAARPGETTDRAGFLDAVNGLRTNAPTLRLTVDDVAVQNDRAAARVRTVGGNEAAFMGSPIAPDRLWPAVDFLRIAGGQIVERWGVQAGSAIFEPLLATTVPVAQPFRKALVLEQWRFAPGAEETSVASAGVLVLRIEAGTLAVRTRQQGGNGEVWVPTSAGPGTGDLPADVVTRLGPGDVLVVAQGDRFAARNDGTDTAVILVVGAVTPAPGPLPTGNGNDAGIVRTVLARGTVTDLPHGQARVTVGRAMLATGATIAPHIVAVSEAAVVEAGTLEQIGDAGAWVTEPGSALPRRAVGQPLPEGRGIVASPGAAVGYRSAGTTPLAILVVAIDPVSPEGQLA